MSFINEVAHFMKLGGQEFPSKPTAVINFEQLDGIIDKMKEEVAETDEALLFHVHGDKVTASRMVDGAIDTAYVALTLAIKVAGEEGDRKSVV